MGFRGALVDKARAIGKSQTGVRIEGTIFRTTERSEWFRVRFDPNPATEQRDDGEVKSNLPATAMISRTDASGSPVNLQGGDKLEVVSANLGNGTYMLTGDPEPLRKKRKVIGYTVNLLQVEGNDQPLRDNADAYNFRILRGQPFELSMTMLQGGTGSTPTDLTGFEAEMPIMDRYGGSTTYLTLSSPDEGITLDEVTGSITISLTTEQVDDLAFDYAYYYLALREISTGQMTDILNGSIEVAYA